MLERFRPHLTYANVMATIAVFMGLGGGAYAAIKLPANSVGSRQIKNKAVTPAKVAPATVARFKGQKGGAGPQGPVGPQGTAGHDGTDASVNGVAAGGDLTGTFPNPLIAPGAVTDTKVAAANKDGAASTPSLRTLGGGAVQALPGNGKAADANLLDGVDSAGFVQGSGSLKRSFSSLLAPGSSTTVNTGLSTIAYGCPSTIGNAGTVTYTNTFGGAAPTWMGHQGSNPSFARLGASPGTVTTAATGDHVIIGALHQISANPRTVLADVYSFHDSGFNGCTVLIQWVAN